MNEQQIRELTQRLNDAKELLLQSYENMKIAESNYIEVASSHNASDLDFKIAYENNIEVQSENIKLKLRVKSLEKQLTQVIKNQQYHAEQ